MCCRWRRRRESEKTRQRSAVALCGGCQASKCGWSSLARTPQLDTHRKRTSRTACSSNCLIRRNLPTTKNSHLRLSLLDLSGLGKLSDQSHRRTHARLLAGQKLTARNPSGRRGASTVPCVAQTDTVHGTRFVVRPMMVSEGRGSIPMAYRENLYQFLATNVSITCRASAPSSDLENAIAPNFKSFPSEVRLNWKTYSATSSMRP